MKFIKWMMVLSLVGCANSHGEYNCPKSTKTDRLAWSADCFTAVEDGDDSEIDLKNIASCSRQSKEIFCKKDK